MQPDEPRFENKGNTVVTIGRCCMYRSDEGVNFIIKGDLPTCQVLLDRPELGGYCFEEDPE